eukprot:Opistho-2@26793
MEASSTKETPAPSSATTPVASEAPKTSRFKVKMMTFSVSPESVKIACCQFTPFFADVAQSQAKVDEMIMTLRPGDVDFLLLPEMSFTGYVFQDREHIRPLLEDAETGPSVTWAKRTAQRLNCHVQVGYPRVQKDGERERCYNSVTLVDPRGVIVITYDKAFLYEVDERWADEGSGFVTTTLPRIGTVGLGICMDLNPYQFKAAFEDYEFANFHRKSGTRLILFSAAWLDDATDSEDVRVIPNYWAARMRPLIGKDVLFVGCNRTGVEGETTFGGCSCVISMREPALLCQMNKRQENVILAQVELPPARPGEP